MKRILFLFFGLSVVAISAFGQGPLKADDKLLQWKLHLPAPSAGQLGFSGGQLNGFLPLPETARAMAVTQRGMIRVLQPDHMPCVVPDLARVERMPTFRAANKDPMPNGFRLSK